MSNPPTSMEERLRLQQRYERLLRERAAAALMGEAAAAAAAEAHEARPAVGANPSWYPPSLLEASTERNPLVINPARIEAAIAVLSDPRNIDLTPRPAHQSAAALRGATAQSVVAAPPPPAAASSAAYRHREFQPLDLSRQQSQQWRPVGVPSTAVAGPSQVYGPQAAGTTAATSAAYIPIERASAAYSQPAGAPGSYVQVPRPYVTYGPPAGPSTAHPQPQPAVRTATCPHVAGHPPAAEREAHVPQMEDCNMQASSFETYRDVVPDSYVYSEQESTTSTLCRVYYTPRMVSYPSHSCPLDNAGSSEGPAPLIGYAPMMPSSEEPVPRGGYVPVTPSSQAPGPRAGYPPMMPSSDRSSAHAGYPPMMPSREVSTAQSGYPPMAPSSEGATPRVSYLPVTPSSEVPPPRAGYLPVVSFGAGSSQAQTAPRYGHGVPAQTAGYQQTWPTVSTHQQPAVVQGPQPGPSRSRPTKRAVPFSDRRTPLQQPRYLQPTADSNSPVEAGPSAGQVPSQGPAEAHTLAMKSEPVKRGDVRRENVPFGRIIPTEMKADEGVSGIQLNKVPGEKITSKRDVARGRDEAGNVSKAEINPEANADQVADVNQEGDADPVADIEGEEAEEQGEEFDVEEYELGPDDVDYVDESSCNDGGNGQRVETPTWQEQVRVPPQAPWAALGGAGRSRPSDCAECARLATPGLRCVTCRWRPMPGEVPAGAVLDPCPSLLFVAAPGSAARGAAAAAVAAAAAAAAARAAAVIGAGSATSAAAGPAAASGMGPAPSAGPGSETAGGSGVVRRSVITSTRQAAQARTSESSVQVDMVSESESGSCSPDGGEGMEEASEEGEEEETDEEENGDEEEEDEEDEDDEDQQESADEAVERRRNPHDIPQQAEAHSTSDEPEAQQDDEGGEGER